MMVGERRPGQIIRGSIDELSPFGMRGWAANMQALEDRLLIEIWIGNSLSDVALASRFRQDLMDAGIGSGRHAFEFAFPAPIDADALSRVRVTANGELLPIHPSDCPHTEALFVLPFGLSSPGYFSPGWRDRDFSQYGEQVHILRYFEENPDAPKYCVDLGAYDGVTGSQSRALLLRGWAGALVEPDPRTFARLAMIYADRPDVTAVRCAVSDQGGVAQMHFTAGPPQADAATAWQFAQVNTLTDAMAEHMAASMDYRFERHPVSVVTLGNLLDWVNAPIEIGFLSIDCEGVDLKIVEALDWRRCRPWLISVECDDASRPRFEAALNRAGYRRYASTPANTLYCRL